ncbi:hypothetical protein HPB52_007957 [Rhipicephalus sanguineus]|uniref:CCHC-type domain-containing protein n=1 Tax=Rhipicephalus sanguineus TaxID=34632 RepID=A0A9D4QHD5_RHISA|nr:hypothetical protein HPB52_007957 [Rhipicephalus sanguineus]
MEVSPSIRQPTSTKRPNDGTSHGSAAETAPGVASGASLCTAPKRPRQMHTNPSSEVNTPEPNSRSSYKVVIKRRSRYDMSTLPNRVVQAALDTCLKTSRFQGFAPHKATNTISVWVPAMSFVEMLKDLQQIQVTEDYALPVQAYLASGTDLRRYVINGVDPNEEPEALLRELSCSTHKVVAARYMGSGRTCLITLQGPRFAPERILYYGCVLRPRPFKPSVVYCYSCFKQGHMKSSCPCSSEDATMEREASAPFRCGLCRTNDHDITSASCPTKQKATMKARQRRPGRPVRTPEYPSMDPVPIHNRYEILASLDADDTHVAPATTTHHSAAPSYSAVVGSSSSRPRRAPPALEDVQLPLANDESEIDSRLASLENEIQRLKQHRALLQRRRDGTHSLHTPLASTYCPYGTNSCPSTQVETSIAPRTATLRCAATPASHIGPRG